ncbi:MAG: SDR family oxidoreductase [Leptolyngbya sp. SIO3F4]|nr:SDR family oxidoreductase [Leptolyngbya sp. SIO3F4]
MLLQNRVALITAGDCRVGRRIASLWARHGASIILCGVDQAQGNNIVHRLEQKGAKARFCLVDVTESHDVALAIREVIATFGRIDILCNNASFGLLGNDTSVLDLTTESWERIVDLSLQGAFFFSQHALPFLGRSETGSIINIVPYPRKGMHVVEGTSRGWMMAMTRDIAEGASKLGVRVNLIWPHVAVSGATLSSYQAALAHKVFRMHRRDKSAARAISRAALYLACDQSVEVTGSMLVVDADYPQWL